MILLRKVRRSSAALLFLAQNAASARHLSKIESITSGSYTVRGLSKRDLESVENIYRSLHDGKALSHQKRKLVRFLGDRIGFGLFREETSNLVGIGVYYFNGRDVDERTVHEGFTGLLPSCQGAGLGSWLRSVAIAHFEKNGLAGVSSRITAGNMKSLKSNERLGFELIERYYDAALGEDRLYLVKRFSAR